MGTVLATEDGGTTWLAQETQGSVTLFDVYFSDPLTGWVVGNAGAMFQTTDGGGRWVDRTLPCSRTCTRLTDLLRIRFTDPKTGWIVGERGMAYHTADSGFTWEEQGARRECLALRLVLSEYPARLGQRRKGHRRASQVGQVSPIPIRQTSTAAR